MTYITCETCNASYNRNNEFVHFLSNTQLKHLNQYYCQQCKLRIHLSERESHLNHNEPVDDPINMKYNKCRLCNISLMSILYYVSDDDYIDDELKKNKNEFRLA